MTLGAGRDNDSGSSTPFRIGLSDVLLVPVATLVGYFTAFGYHREYASFFGIPPELIRFDLGTILIAATGILSLALTVAFYVAAVYFVYGKPTSPFQQRLRRLLLPVALSGVILSTYPRMRFLVLGVLVFLAFYELILPWIRHPQVGGYSESLQIDEREWGKGLFGGPFGFSVVVALMALVLISFGSFAGRFAAVNAHRFLVLAERPEFIVPIVYDDTLVAVRINKKAKRILPDLLVLTREPGHSWKLRWEETGKLTPSGE